MNAKDSKPKPTDEEIAREAAGTIGARYDLSIVGIAFVSAVILDAIKRAKE